MSVVEKNEKKPLKINLKLCAAMVVFAIMAGFIYGVLKSETYSEIKASLSESKEFLEHIQEQKMRAYEAAEEYEPYEREEREEDKGFAYDDFETDYDYEM